MVVAIDGRRAASFAAEWPRLDAQAASGAQREGAAKGGVGWNALSVPDGPLQRAVHALFLRFVEDVEVAGAVGGDAERPGEVARAVAVVAVDLRHVAGETLSRAVDVELVDGARQHRAGPPTAAVTVAACGQLVDRTALPGRRKTARSGRHLLFLIVDIVVIRKSQLAAEPRHQRRKLGILLVDIARHTDNTHEQDCHEIQTGHSVQAHPNRNARDTGNVT